MLEKKNFKAIIDNSLESIIFLDVNHKVLAFNKNCQTLQKEFHNREIKIGDTYYPEFIIAENKELYLNAFNLALKGNPSSVRHLVTKNSSKRWFEFKVLPVYNDNELEGVTLYAKDISDEKEKEMKMYEMFKIFKSILDSVEESVVLLDKNYKIIVFNKLFETRAFENSGRHAQSGDDFREYIHDESVLFFEHFNRAIKGENSIIDIPYQNSVSETIWYQTRFTAVYDEMNELIGVTIIANDITKEKKIELLLIESEKNLKLIVENNPIAKFIIQKELLIYINPVFEKLYGYSKNSILNNMSFDEFVFKEDIKIYYQFLKKNLKNKKNRDSLILRTIDKNGKILYMEFYANSIVYNNVTAIIGSLVDITERILEENRINVAILETQEKERMQIGMELHDNVKQILSGISIYLDVVQKKIDDKEVVLGILNKLKKYNNDAVTELRRLSHQLAPLVEDDTSLKDKIDWLIQSLKLHDSFSIHVNVDEINFKFNNNIQLHFYRILQELLGNIVKYSKAKKVEISISKTNDSVLFVVKDNGIGFDVSQKKQGIGLENIRRRVKILNGELKVNSEIGKGVEVLIKVPLV